MTTDRPINRDEFEAVRSGVWEYGMNILRFSLFDLGSLLLRNDKDGSRRKQWKDEVSTWMYAALNDEVVGLQQLFDPNTNVTGLAYSIKRFYSQVEFFMVKLGEAVMEEDQYEYYRIRLNNALYAAQRDTAQHLFKASQSTERQGFNQYDPRNVHLEGMEWKNRCATDGNYEFVVAENSAPVCREAYVGY
jgi:hypothetical protein